MNDQIYLVSTFQHKARSAFFCELQATMQISRGSKDTIRHQTKMEAPWGIWLLVYWLHIVYDIHCLTYWAVNFGGQLIAPRLERDRANMYSPMMTV